ncbi:MAG: hypothetical protein ACRDHY_10140 [Anaerolineales bacterium]
MKRAFPAVLAVAFSALVSACAAIPTVAPASEPGALGVLLDALRAAGATVEPVREIRQPFLSVPGKVLTVNGVEIQVFEYENEAAMRAEAETISADASSVGTTIVTWVDAPHFFASGKLIVIYVGTESWLVKLLGAILGQPIAVGVGTRP